MCRKRRLGRTGHKHLKKKVKVEQKAKEDDVRGDCDAATAAEVVSNIDEALDSEHDAEGNHALVVVSASR